MHNMTQEEDAWGTVHYCISHLQPPGLTVACHQNYDNKMFVSPSLRGEETFIIDRRPTWLYSNKLCELVYVKTDWHAMPAATLHCTETDRVSANLTEQNMQQHSRPFSRAWRAEFLYQVVDNFISNYNNSDLLHLVLSYRELLGLDSAVQDCRSVVRPPPGHQQARQKVNTTGSECLAPQKKLLVDKDSARQYLPYNINIIFGNNKKL